MTARSDLSKVSPKGAYVAKRCPMRVQLDVLQPSAELPASAELQLRFDEGDRFEAEVVELLRKEAAADWVFIDEGHPDATNHTLGALAAGAPVIVGSHLPPDEEGKRSGRPDLLVRHGQGYVPVDVKHHRTLEAKKDALARTSTLAAPAPGAATDRAGSALRRNKDDALQLAHYQRMLESLGYAAAEAVGGIVGTELCVTWYRLDEPLWQTPAKSDGKRVKRRTTLETYDFEFGFRLDIAAAAHAFVDDSAEDSAQELLVVPVRCGDCPECGWREHCGELLNEGAGDPSLLPRVGYRPWRLLRDAGITDRAGVAALDYRTARLGADGVDLSKVLESGAATDPGTPIAEMLKGAPRQIRLLEEHGLRTAGEALEQLERATARFGGARFLPDAILHARAALGPADVYRLDATTAPDVPRADIEIDVDMESYGDLVYLWGVNVHDRSGTGLAEEGYKPFVTWAPLDPAEEARLFADFWSWLRELRRSAASAGRSLRCYVWNQSAENTKMRNAARGTSLADEVEELIASDQWIDLRDVFSAQWTTGGTTGLKTIAQLAGYRWKVDDPGGAQSMVRYAQAVGIESAEDGGAEARAWLETYNCGDVEATLAVRRWLDEEGAEWPQLDLEGPWRGAGSAG